MDTIKIAVILPSRGLMFSETADELLQNLQGYDYDIFFAHGEPIPDCFEKPLRRALRGAYTHIWMVEDDMILPEETLSAMLLQDTDVVTMDYPVSKSGQGATFLNKEGEVIFSGTGCLLVKRAVFDKLKKPYFRTDIRWSAANYGKFIRLTAMLITNPTLEGYGLHDTNFGIKLYHAGIRTVIAGKIGQRKLVALGKPGTNEGAHHTEEWVKLKPNVLLKKFQAQPVMPIGKLVEVQTVSGKLNVLPEKARKLIKAGVATAVPTKSVGFDFSGYVI